MGLKTLGPDLFLRLKTAVTSNKPLEELVNFAIVLKNEGWIRTEVKDLYMGFLDYICNEGTEEQEDAVRDALDCIVGWGSTDIFKDS